MFKGYASSLKIDGSEVAFPTVEPVRPEQHGISVLAHQFVRSIADDAAEAGSGQRVIIATAHAAFKGDVILLTSGSNAGRESKVASISANQINLVDDITVDDGDDFTILRHKYPMVDADGGLQTSLSAAPIKYDEDGVAVDVHEDTDTPANSKPLPVKVLNSSNGAPVDLLTQATGDDILTELEDLNAVDFASGAKQDAAKTVLDNLLTELQLKADLSETQPISAASLPLPAGAATSAAQATAEAVLDDILAQLTANGTIEADISTSLDDIEANVDTLVTRITKCNTDSVIVSSSALPTGAATEATLAAASAKLPSSLGTKTAANSLSVVPASDYVPPAPAGNGYADSARKATGSVTTGAWVELITSTAAAAKGLCVFDSSGQTLELGVGGSGSEARKLIIPPGGLNGFIPLAIPAGSRISVRAVSGTADYTSAELDLTLLG